MTFIKRSASDDASNDAAQHLLAAHAQHITDAIVNGIAGDAPRSAVPNLAAVLSALVSKFPAETRVWLQHSMQNVRNLSYSQIEEHTEQMNLRFQPRLAENPRVTHEAKETFLKTINAYALVTLFSNPTLISITRSRSSQRTVTASNEFALIARGLSGTSYAAGQVL